MGTTESSYAKENHEKRLIRINAVSLLEHGGQQYELDKICTLEESGMKLKNAIIEVQPTIPEDACKALINKIRATPYYKARKDISLSIIKEKGPALQQNLLEIAFNGKSERNRLDATIDALDRSYGKSEDNSPQEPQYVFNFSFGDSSSAPAKVRQATDAKEILDGETFID